MASGPVEWPQKVVVFYFVCALDKATVVDNRAQVYFVGGR